MSKTKITLGFSPCPNDCFMFDALVHGRIGTKHLEIVPVIEDVETLNRMAFSGKLDATKLSYHALAHLADRYQLLSSGSALGFNCGPLLIALPATAEKIKNDPAAVSSLSVAIPGRYTTANFLLSLAYPALKNKSEIIFSAIEDALLERKADLGLIIHENRFTYEGKGLVKIRDLGEWWEQHSASAIPLGGIAVRRDLSSSDKLLMNELVRASTQYAFDHPAAAMPFIRQHAQAMDEKVMQQHIDLYVNKFSLDLGETGRAAVKRLFETAVQTGVISTFPGDLLVC